MTPLPAGLFGTILADPPWRFTNRTGKVAPEHGRLCRYPTMSFHDIRRMEVIGIEASHLYLWCPAAMMREAFTVMEWWGFEYKTCIVWEKIRKDGQPDGRGCGFFFRLVTEFLLFGVRGKLRTREAGRRQVNLFRAPKQDHSRKPEELRKIIEACSPGPYLELFARGRPCPGWTQWGDQLPTEERT
jgi:N6-adenosine-specific RNA methylase IME4